MAAGAVLPPCPPSKLFTFFSMSLLMGLSIFGNKNVVTVGAAQGSWCVARSDATNQALQTALDYACGAGADCFTLQSDGLCFLPNTLQAHASYAFNSFYQRKGRVPGSCDFAGTATIAQSDPSYGSCVYPSSASTAGGSSTVPTTTGLGSPNVPTTTTTTTTTPVYGGGGSGGLTPGMTPPIPDTDNSRASSLGARIHIYATVILCIFIPLILN